MKKTIKSRKTPQQARSKQTRKDILEATTHLLNRKPLGEVSTNHIAKKTGISIGTLYKYYPNKDAILADLSLVFMQQDAELFGQIFESSPRRRQKKDVLVDDLVEALMTVHRDDAQVRGVVYQNLERLKLLGPAQSATRKIQAKGTASVPELNPILTWVAISAINAAVHSMSQLSRELQQWDFVRVLVRNILDNLLNPYGSVGRPKRMKP
ncbi:TetR/AcrR family transcriptional regulator [Granulicella arctica]|uniref:AcrR family transcriptional regulator n=1 Tax=Granulicella arctica TaxID=940613 RepID=A0A7Y9PFI6_9BACT|nr:TetR/AcrR family transcriptional regulator [Granulicella arctica]NYF78765.1 AcrR family transcriptional regulator [Granulicella arctica]